MIKKTNLPEVFLISLIVLIGGFLRFYKINWGDGYFFHPDEYHIVNSVNQLSLPNQMNPNFFSYGSFTIYLIYFTKLILLKLGFPANYSLVFFIGRFYSALFSTLSLVAIFFLTKRLIKKISISLLVTFLTAFTPGLIQQAHFATPESSLTFWLSLTIFLIISWLEDKKIKLLYLSAITLGVASAVKIVALSFLPIYSLLILEIRGVFRKHFVQKTKQLFIIFAISCASFLIFFPYSFLDWEHFRNSLSYEGSVADGSQVVFYTRQFINTLPIIFQFQKILPYSLGPALLVFGILGFLVLIQNILKKSLPHAVIFLGFVLFFLSNALLFAKWVRFVAPTFPFWAIFTGLFIDKLEATGKSKLANTVTAAAIFFTVIWSAMFFSIYTKEDIRISATNWIQENIRTGSFILTESRNMLEVPLTGNYKKVVFDFYDLDQKPLMLNELSKNIRGADYFIIQGRRIYKNHQRLADQYPLINNFYFNLFQGTLGFTKLTEFTSYPELSISGISFEIPDEDAEETWSVFDHPRIIVFKKQYNLPEEKLLMILKGN